MNLEIKLPNIRNWLIKHYFLFITIIIIVLCLVNSFVLTYSLSNSSNTYVDQLLSETANGVDLALEKVETVAAILNNNSTMQKLFTSLKTLQAPQSFNKMTAVRSELLKAISSITVADSNITNVTLSDDTDIVFMSSDYKKLEEYPAYLLSIKDELDSSFSSYKWSSLHPITDKTNVVTFHRYMVDNEKISVLGHIFVCMNKKTIESILSQSKIGKSSFVYLCDAEGHVIASSESSPNIRDIDNGEIRTHNRVSPFKYHNKYYYFRSLELTNAPWTIMVYIPFEDIFQTLSSSLLTIIAIGLVSLICCIFLSVSMARRIVNPIKRIQDGMLQIEAGDLNTVLEDSNFQETHVLGESINHMVQTVSHMTDQLTEERLRQKEIELELLKAQINPHFIYNTLETINLKLLIDGQKDLSGMITDLGDILRQSVKQSESEVLLGEDINNIHKYLNIQSVRYGSKHKYNVSVSEEACKCKVLSMMIQPFVENAIYHGMSGMKPQYSLTIDAVSNDSELTITVSDDGDGMSKEVLNSILEAESETSSEVSHIGTRNTIRRIRLYYGDKAKVSMQSELGAGTTLRIVLPVIK